jgi:hypothetical protein
MDSPLLVILTPSRRGTSTGFLLDVDYTVQRTSPSNIERYFTKLWVVATGKKRIHRMEEVERLFYFMVAWNP